MGRTLALALMLAASAANAAPPASQRNFVACPIVQDTSTVPCWVAEYQGETYYLGIQTDISSPAYPPFLGHQALIEGTVTGEPRICGGIVLKPLTVSTLPELAPQCSEIRPQRADYQVPFAPRGPGPSKRGLAFAPAPGTAGPPPAEPAPTPPFQARTFTVPYEFDTPSVTGRTSRVLQQAVTYARAVKASQIEVTGYRGQVLLSDGTILKEAPGIAEARARQVGELLTQVGVAASGLKVVWNDVPEDAGGVGDGARRRTTILVTP
jgi:outer membrane protein OmpA-like peptidoglycan-associated protein